VIVIRKGNEMNLHLLLAILLLASWRQDPQQKKEQPNHGSAKEMALESIKSATPVNSEKFATPATAVRQPIAAPAASAKHQPGHQAQANPRPAIRSAAQDAASPSDAEKKATALYQANAKFQQELAKRRQIISVYGIDTPEAALAELQAGNERFVGSGRVRTLLASQDASLRESLAKGQAPFAVLVTCSDSRATDSFVFDQELGRLFSIRSAGNSPDTLGIASVEYGVEHLGSKIVVILGHTSCGAISAVADAKDEHLHGNFHIFQEVMEGLLHSTARDPNEREQDYKNRLAQVNAIRQAKAVYERSPVLRELIEHKKIWLVPAIHDLHSGKVTFFEPVGK
jgi:carbonic anhydrase